MFDIHFEILKFTKIKQFQLLNHKVNQWEQCAGHGREKDRERERVREIMLLLSGNGMDSGDFCFVVVLMHVAIFI